MAVNDMLVNAHGDERARLEALATLLRGVIDTTERD